MPKIIYIKKKFSSDTLKAIKAAEDIIAVYRAQGFTLTLRQLYYQFVTRGLIPNTEQSYKRIGDIVSDARRAGMIDWEAIEDRTRYLRKLSFWSSPLEMAQVARDSYHRDLWANQSLRLEVWIEKDALIGVIEDVCRRNDVPYFSCRGYVSDSEMWAVAMRVLRNVKNGQGTVILHFGDHDPSGIDMTRDLNDRIDLFSAGSDFMVRRLALTMDQIGELKPPPNPAKVTDSRYSGYADRFGTDSWELDALEPSYIAGLIEAEITKLRDDGKWNELYSQQEKERKQLDEVVKRWGELFK